MANIKKVNLNGTTYDITDAIVRSSVANEYSASATYAVGDYCIKDGVVYKCNTAISTAEAWNASHWTEVKVMDEIESAQGTTASADKLTTARAIDGVNFDGTAAIVHFGTCSTAIGTAAKTVSCTGYTLVTGARIIVYFTNGNNVANPTLSVNSTTAKSIQFRGSNLTAANNIKAKTTLELVYDGTAYQIVGILDGALDATISGLATNKTITALTETDGIISASASNISITRSQVSDIAGVIMYYGECSTATATAAKVVTVQDGFSLTSGACVRVKFTNENVSVPTLNVNGTGAKDIYWKGASHTSGAPDYLWNAGTVMDFVYDGTRWNLVDNGLNFVIASYTSGTETLNLNVTSS